MRRFALPLVIVAVIAVSALLAWIALNRGHLRTPSPQAGDAVATAAPTVRELPPFRVIDVTGTADITLEQGDRYSIAIDAPGTAARSVVAEVKGDTLVVVRREEPSGPAGWFGRGADKPVRMTITFRDIDKIELAGAVRLAAGRLQVPALKVGVAGTGTLRIDDLQTESLRVSGAGAVKAELAGRATEQVLSIAGAGSYNAARLETIETRASVSGAGKVVVNAKKTLKISLSGAGVVEYLGDPEVKQSVSGMGKVRRRDVLFELHRPHVAAVPVGGPVSARSLPRPPESSRA